MAKFIYLAATIYDQAQDLISKKDVSRIKIKLGKSHRKETDWEIIKEILSSSNVIVIEPRKPDLDIKVLDHIAYRKHYFYIFTNLQDAMQFVRKVNVEDNKIGRDFFFGTPLKSVLQRLCKGLEEQEGKHKRSCHTFFTKTTKLHNN